jgi:hypothetical protein
VFQRYNTVDGGGQPVEGELVPGVAGFVEGCLGGFAGELEGEAAEFGEGCEVAFAAFGLGFCVHLV